MRLYNANTCTPCVNTASTAGKHSSNNYLPESSSSNHGELGNVVLCGRVNERAGGRKPTRASMSKALQHTNVRSMGVKVSIPPICPTSTAETESIAESINSESSREDSFGPILNRYSSGSSFLFDIDGEGPDSDQSSYISDSSSITSAGSVLETMDRLDLDGVPSPYRASTPKRPATPYRVDGTQSWHSPFRDDNFEQLFDTKHVSEGIAPIMPFPSDAHRRYGKSFQREAMHGTSGPVVAPRRSRPPSPWVAFEEEVFAPIDPPRQESAPTPRIRPGLLSSAARVAASAGKLSPQAFLTKRETNNKFVRGKGFEGEYVEPSSSRNPKEDQRATKKKPSLSMKAVESRVPVSKKLCERNDQLLPETKVQRNVSSALFIDSDAGLSDSCPALVASIKQRGSSVRNLPKTTSTEQTQADVEQDGSGTAGSSDLGPAFQASIKQRGSSVRNLPKTTSTEQTQADVKPDGSDTAGSSDLGPAFLASIKQRGSSVRNLPKTTSTEQTQADVEQDGSGTAGSSDLGPAFQASIKQRGSSVRNLPKTTSTEQTQADVKPDDSDTAGSSDLGPAFLASIKQRGSRVCNASKTTPTDHAIVCPTQQGNILPPTIRRVDQSKKTISSESEMATPEKYAQAPKAGLSQTAAENSWQQDDLNVGDKQQTPVKSGEVKSLPEKYARMLKVGLPQAAVDNALQRDGLIPDDYKEKPPSESVDVKALPEKYARMLKVGLPQAAVDNALQRDGLNPDDYKAHQQGAPSPVLPKETVRRFRVHWEPHENTRSNTLWAMVRRDEPWLKSVHTDPDEMERLFEEPKTCSKPFQSDTRSSGTRLIDAKRANNGGILLARIRMGYDQVSHSINLMEESCFSLEQLDGLASLVPTDEERRILKDFLRENRKEALTTECEKFMAQLLPVDKAEEKLEAMVFMKRFPDAVGQLKSDSKLIQRACDEIQVASRFRRVLGLILHLGNEVNNRGRSKARAMAVRLESLQKLHQGKAFDRKTSFLQYVVRVIGKSAPELLDFGTEISTLKLAEKVAWGQSLKELELLESRLMTMRQDLLENQNLTGQEEFESLQSTHLGRFVLSAFMDMKSVYDYVNSAKLALEATTDYFGEDDGESLLQGLYKLCTTFDEAAASERAFSSVSMSLSGGGKQKRCVRTQRIPPTAAQSLLQEIRSHEYN